MIGEQVLGQVDLRRLDLAQAREAAVVGDAIDVAQGLYAPAMASASCRSSMPQGRPSPSTTGMWRQP